MLVLTRKVGDSILIGGSIKVQVVKVKGCQVRIGIEAPKDTKIYRHEILEGVRKDSPEKEKVSVVGVDSKTEPVQHTTA